MSEFIVEGGSPLSGELRVQGAKNAVLPILAATVMSSGECVIKNCPRLSDVEQTILILEGLGCGVKREGSVITVSSDTMNGCSISGELMRRMRSSIIFLGAIISKCRKASVCMPGGCPIGSRPIDLHLSALKQMGVDICEEHGYIKCSCDALKGADIHLDFPSVGATENIMLAAAGAEGVTTISNAAREPEVRDLAKFLNKMGAKVFGAGSDFIRIEGAERLGGAEHTIMPDRIAAATYLAAAMITGGSIFLTNARPGDMGAMLHSLKDMGARLTTGASTIYLEPTGSINAIRLLRTMPYPGFPTDIQSPFMALAAKAEGTSVFVENIFENRFRHVDELVRMGADIRTEGRIAIVKGVRQLYGARVSASELRGGAALVTAALAAEGTSVISGIEHIDRGYEAMEKQLASCGAKIRRTSPKI